MSSFRRACLERCLPITIRLMTGLALLAPAVATAGPAAPGDAGRGASLFRQCAACHSVAPGRHLTGPSLAGVWGRKAGSAEGFTRYPDALRQSGLVWDEKTLEAWLENPQQVVPGTFMTFPGVPNDRQRADVVAFLKAASQDDGAQAAPGGGGMTGGAARPNLKESGQDQRVTAIRYCGDGYRVTTASGRTLVFWEFNLRFKTDSSAEGPAKGKPVLLQAGMMGDRGSIVFAGPEEISATIQREC